MILPLFKIMKACLILSNQVLHNTCTYNVLFNIKSTGTLVCMRRLIFLYMLVMWYKWKQGDKSISNKYCETNNGDCDTGEAAVIIY